MFFNVLDEIKESDSSDYGSEVDSKKDGNKEPFYNPMAKFQF